MNIIDLDGFIGDYAAFASVSLACAPSYTGATIGSRLCYKSEALAKYSGRQFADLWADFNLIHK